MFWAVLLLCLGAVRDSDGPWEIAGTVVDEGGAPAGEARVFAVLPDDGPDGRAAVESTTAPDGTFRLAVPASARTWPLRYARLVAYREGAGLAIGQWSGDAGPPDAPVRLQLRPATTATIDVVTMAGRPVAGARVIVESTREASLPPALADRLAVMTDAAGRAAIPGIESAKLGRVRVEAPGFGVQRLLAWGTTGRPLPLIDPARVVGRLVADPPADLAGLALEVNAHGPASGGSMVGTARVTTGPDGQFEVPALASGIVEVHVRDAAGSRWIALSPPHRYAPPGRETALDVPVRRGVLARGVVREAGTNRPLPGMSVSLQDGRPRTLGMGSSLLTDQDGRFEAVVLPGAVVVSAYSMDPASRRPVPPLQATVPDGAAMFDLPPVEVPRAEVVGEAVRGRVLNPEGRPAAGATVQATQITRREPGGVRSTGSPGPRTMTAADGTFAFEGLEAGTDLTLVALGEGAMTEGPTGARAGAGEPVTLRMKAIPTMPVEGRVVDASGRPVPEARVQVSWQGGGPQGASLYFGETPDRELYTDREGRFRAADKALATGQYTVMAYALGHRPGQQVWTPPAAGGPHAFPDVVLTRVEGASVRVDGAVTAGATLEGRVVDGRGEPVAGAKVVPPGPFWTTRYAETGPDGRFRLGNLVGGVPPFVVARAEGFRRGGAIVPKAGEPVTIVLTRQAAAPAGPPPAPAPPRDRARERELARGVVRPVVEPAFATAQPASRFETLRRVAPLAPAEVLDDLDAGRSTGDANNDDWLRLLAAEALLPEGPDEALALIERLPSAYDRFHGHRAAALLPGLPAATRRERLDAAIFHLKAVEDRRSRRIALDELVGALLDAGEPARARPFLDELAATYRADPDPRMKGYGLRTVLPHLARIDPAAARALVKGEMPEDQRPEGFLRLACETAADDPAEALRLYERARASGRLFGDPLEFAYRLAGRDPGGAIGLARAIEDPRKAAEVYALIALAQGESDPQGALRTVEEAFDRLETYASPNGGPIGHAGAAALLLPAVRRAAPDRLRESLWRVLDVGRLSFDTPVGDARLARLVAPFDRDLARALIEPRDGPVRLPSGPMMVSMRSSPEEMLLAIATYDPARAAALADELPAPTAVGPGARSTEARLRLAAYLLAEDEPRAQPFFGNRLTNRWYPGKPAGRGPGW